MSMASSSKAAMSINPWSIYCQQTQQTLLFLGTVPAINNPPNKSPSRQPLPPTTNPTQPCTPLRLVPPLISFYPRFPRIELSGVFVETSLELGIRRGRGEGCLFFSLVLRFLSLVFRASLAAEIFVHSAATSWLESPSLEYAGAASS